MSLQTSEKFLQEIVSTVASSIELAQVLPAVVRLMAQTGTLVVCGDAGEALGDSIYEARLYVAGSVSSLGADCVEKEMRDEHVRHLAGLLEAAEIDSDPAGFRRYGSERRLYTFKVDNAY